MDKIAAFDFCETLVSFQTGDKFIEYCIENIGDDVISKRYKKFLAKENQGYYMRLDKWFKGKMHKKLALVKILKGQSSKNIDTLAGKYYKECVKPELIPQTMDYFNQLKDAGYKMVIVSAGYSPYIEKFCEEQGNIACIANDFKYYGSRFSGRLVKRDCYGEEKVTRFYKEYDIGEINELIFVSDSMSDKPMFDIADIKVFVTKNRKKIIPDWKMIYWGKSDL